MTVLVRIDSRRMKQSIQNVEFGMETLPNAFDFRVMQNYDPETILI